MPKERREHDGYEPTSRNYETTSRAKRGVARGNERVMPTQQSTAQEGGLPLPANPCNLSRSASRVQGEFRELIRDTGDLVVP